MQLTRVINPPIEEPVTLAQAKNNLRITHNLEDLHIDGLISTARAGVELYTGQSLMPQTRELVLDQLNCINWLSYGPVQSIESIHYIDYAGNLVLMDSSQYRLLKNDGYDFFTLAPLKQWPSVLPCESAISVRYVCGYTTAEAVPNPLRHAILLAVNELYENREMSIVGQSYNPTDAYKRLLDPYRRMVF